MLLAELGAPDSGNLSLWVAPPAGWLAGWHWLEGQGVGSVRSGGLTEAPGPGGGQLTRLVRAWAWARLTTCLCEI